MKSVNFNLSANATAGNSVLITTAFTPRMNLTIKKIYSSLIVKDSVTLVTKSFESSFEFLQTAGDIFINSIPGVTSTNSYSIYTTFNNYRDIDIDTLFYLKTGITYTIRHTVYASFTATDNISGGVYLLFK